MYHDEHLPLEMKTNEGEIGPFKYHCNSDALQILRQRKWVLGVKSAISV